MRNTFLKNGVVKRKLKTTSTRKLFIYYLSKKRKFNKIARTTNKQPKKRRRKKKEKRKIQNPYNASPWVITSLNDEKIKINTIIGANWWSTVNIVSYKSSTIPSNEKMFNSLLKMLVYALPDEGNKEDFRDHLITGTNLIVLEISSDKFDDTLIRPISYVKNNR